MDRERKGGREREGERLCCSEVDGMYMCIHTRIAVCLFVCVCVCVCEGAREREREREESVWV